MKTKKMAILTASLIIVLCAVVVVGATFALFGKTIDKNVTVTTGDVTISADFGKTPELYSLINGEQKKLSEAEGEDYDNNFYLGGTAELDPETGVLSLTGLIPGDKAEISLTITNKSSVAVKYCVVAEVSGELAADEQNGVKVDTGVASGTDYTWTEIAVDGETTITISVELPKTAKQVAEGDRSCEVLFTIYAGQSNASDEDLEALFGLN